MISPRVQLPAVDSRTPVVSSSATMGSAQGIAGQETVNSMSSPNSAILPTSRAIPTPTVASTQLHGHDAMNDSQGGLLLGGDPGSSLGCIEAAARADNA